MHGSPDLAARLCTQYPDLAGLVSRHSNPAICLRYGTAGFREKSELLDSTLFRMGLLAALRSRSTQKAVGLMVTASHNLEPDNGVKLIDPEGEMLTIMWERYATLLANARAEEVGDILDSLVREEGIDTSRAAKVFFGRDTRRSSPQLCALAIEGCISIGGEVIDCGLLTTPQLHHIVRMTNRGLSSVAWASELGYYELLTGALRMLLGLSFHNSFTGRDMRKKLVIDGAFGVGASKAAHVAHLVQDSLEIEVRNHADAGRLNEDCGAEYVQKGRIPPCGFDPVRDGGVRCCSVDGDADRVVFHYFGAGSWHLLDGDKIAALAATFVQQNLNILGLSDEFRVAVVQTAYANGASTRYIRNLGIDVPLAKTGVKFVHHKACEYDVGVYFEANGHGTVLFGERLLARLEGVLAAVSACATTSDEQPSLSDSAQGANEKSAQRHSAAAIAAAAGRLLAASRLLNQATGDALSDILFVEAALSLLGWSVEDWDGIYADLPSRQLKLAVRDRSVVTNSEDETRCVSPPNLQPAIDAIAARFASSSGRVFVRPSGTENVLRVYAEAASEAAADALSAEVAAVAFDLAGGLPWPTCTVSASDNALNTPMPSGVFSK